MTTKFLSSSGATLDLSSGTADLYIRSLRIADAAPSDNLQTNSYNKVISTSETHTNDELVFRGDGYSSFNTVGWANGTKTGDITHNNTIVGKPVNTLKSYAYSEATFDPSHQDFDIKITLNSTPEDDIYLVFSTVKNTSHTTAIADYGVFGIRFQLGSSTRQVEGFDLFDTSNRFTQNYTTNGVAVNDTFDIICENGVVKLYYKGLTIANVPDFKCGSGNLFYIGVQDPNTASGNFSIDGQFRSKARTHKIKTQDGKLKVTDQSNLDILTLSDEKVHAAVKITQMYVHRQTFASDAANLSPVYQTVICDTSANSSFCSLYLPDLSLISQTYILMLFRIGGQDVRVFPSGSNTIDGSNSSSYVEMRNNYDSVMLIASVESNGTKQWLLHG